jgi:hypothetical protein
MKNNKTLSIREKAELKVFNEGYNPRLFNR